ncbi:MAG: ROK family glucokinase [Clostridia bacterium]|nr:ROK family glucokinase [Clostridia bacterium]
MIRLGVDLGGTNIAVGIVDENFKIIHKDSVPTGATRPAEEIVADIAALCKKVVSDTGMALSDVAAIGIAAPGTINSTTGTVEYANNLPFRHFPIAALLREAMGADIPVFVENDANAAAWGEAIAGAAKGAADSVMITLGTGVGGGIIINHKLYSGFNGAGAELGHMVIVKDGAPCSCGRKGCWEAYSSATALIRITNEKLAACAAEGRATVMTELAAKKGRVTGRTAFDGMRAGDAAATEVVDDYVSYLACGIVNLINIFQPKILSIGGGISGEGQNLLDLLMPKIAGDSYGSGATDESKTTKICIAQLGNDAGIIGAAVLGLEV